MIAGLVKEGLHFKAVEKGGEIMIELTGSF